jgi:hypothetical protein
MRASGKTALSGLLDAIKDRPHRTIPSTLSFLQLDTEKVAKDLALEERARSEGEACRPAADSDSFDIVESEIVSTVEQERNTAFDELQQQLATYDDRLANLRIQSVPLLVRSAVKDSVQEFTARSRTWINDLGIEREEVGKATSTLQRFQAKHDLDRPARFPNSFIMHYAWVLIVVVIEAVMNGYFFSKSNDHGLIGGVFQAILIAVLNVGVAILISRFGIRQLNHRGTVRKRIGWIALLSLVAAIPAFNLFVAHFRDGLILATTSSPLAEATTRALEALGRLSVTLHDFESYVLWGLGSIFAVIASFKGYTDDDPYPGYGTVYRQWRDLHEAYAEKSKVAIEELRSINQETAQQFKLIIDALTKNCNEHDVILKRRARIICQYQSFVSHLESAANQLLTRYRELNRAARPDETAPARFSSSWQFSKPIEQDFGTPSAVGPEQLKTVREDVDRELSEGLEHLDAAFNEAVRTIPSVDEILEREVKGNGQSAA